MLVVEESLQRPLHASESHHSWCSAGFEFHQQVHVTVGAEILAQRAAEHGEPTNLVVPTKRREGLAVEAESGGDQHGYILSRVRNRREARP